MSIPISITFSSTSFSTSSRFFLSSKMFLKHYLFHCFKFCFTDFSFVTTLNIFEPLGLQSNHHYFMRSPRFRSLNHIISNLNGHLTRLFSPIISSCTRKWYDPSLGIIFLSMMKGNLPRSPLKKNLSSFYAILLNPFLLFVQVKFPFPIWVSINTFLSMKFLKSTYDCSTLAAPHFLSSDLNIAFKFPQTA